MKKKRKSAGYSIVAHNKKVFFMGLLLVFAAAAFLISINGSPSSLDLQAQQGILELDVSSLKKAGSVTLDGEWEFYWQQRIEPGDFSVPIVEYAQAPGYWTTYEDNLPSIGFATYRLLVKTSEPAGVLALRTSEIYTEYAVFVNGKALYQHGIFAGNAPRYLNPDVYTFSAPDPVIEIMIQVQNQQHFNAGIGKSLSLGIPEYMHKKRNQATAIDIMLFAICLTAGGYHLILHFYRKQDKRLLYFAMLCIFVAIRGLFANETYIMQLFPELSFAAGSKIVHMLMPMMMLAMLAYSRCVYQKRIQPRLFAFLFGTSIAYLLAVFATHSYFFTRLANLYFMIVVLALAVLLYVSGQQLVQKQILSGYFFAGTAAMTIAVFNDILYYHKIINTGYWFSLGLVVFIFSQTVMLAKDYSRIYKERADLYGQLMQTNLAFMQAQIKPHFIYNALSTISYLTTKDPQKAKDLLLDFSDYLRGSFSHQNESGLTSLDQELQLVDAYLAIEKERFGDRIQTVFTITQDREVLIPAFCIQPIVENAIRHGLTETIEGGTVTISVLGEDQGTRVIVEDNGAGMEQEKADALLSGSETGGVGIKNIQNRLQFLYQSGLTIRSLPGKGTRVEFFIPYVDNKVSQM